MAERKNSEEQRILEKGASPAADVRLLRSPPGDEAVSAALRAWAERLAPACYLDVGNVCNQHCLYCAVPRRQAYRAACGEVERVALQALSHGFDVAALIGGEPTIWPHLMSTLTRLQKGGVRRFILATNGLMLAYPETVDRLVDAGVDCVGLSLDDFDPAVQARLTRSDKNPELVGRALDNLGLRDDVDTYIYTVVTGALRDRMESHIAECRRLAARFARPPAFIFAALKPVATALEHWPELALSLTETAALVAQAQAGLGRRAVVTWRDIPLCLPGLTPDRSLDCHHRQAAVDLESGEILDPPLARDRTFVETCADCRLRPWCPGMYTDYVARYGDGEFKAIE